MTSMRDGDWLGAVLTAQKAAEAANPNATMPDAAMLDTPNPVDRRHRVRSIVGGIALALMIGGGLFVVAVLNS